jgi:hypothetical protein
MRRRDFLTASALALATPILARAADQPAGSGGAAARQYFELRTYHFASAEKQAAFERFLKDAAIPAFNRAGVEPVGAFKPLAKDNPQLKLTAEPLDCYLLLPHNSLDSFLALPGKLAADATYQEAGKAILTAPKSDPAFARYDSTLLYAMESAPRIAPPSEKSDNRLFELRTYQSPNEERAANKLAMFNAGEIPVFTRAGMAGVFFGGAIAGDNLPKLTYMVTHDSAENVKSHWGNFGKDPDWKKLSGNPAYKDNVSKIINTFLRPIAGSQI